jgi:transposase InsO family protein
MGSIGDCYDNAMIEAFWSRMQVELLDTRRWKTRIELATAIFEYRGLPQPPPAALGARDADTD